MPVAYFQTLFLASEEGREFFRKFRQEAIPRLLGRSEISRISVYTPGQTTDPYIDDGAPPAVVIELDVPDTAALSELFEAAEVGLALAPPAGATANYDVFETMSFGTRRTAPVSYAVRYFPPVEDAGYFVDHYLRSHVPILQELPGVRNILCYLPVPWRHPSGMRNSGCILGNEVVFDTFESLDTALSSDVRHRLRKDFHAFPMTPGDATHYAMRREDFY